MSRVLIVDDDVQILEGLATLFEKERPQYEVSTAQNGLEAWQLVRQIEIDLLITDISMPEMTGVELLEQIGEEGLDIPSIVISGYNDYQYVRGAMRCGALDYILKPIDHGELIEMADKAIESEKKRSELSDWQIQEGVFDYLISQRWAPRCELQEYLTLHGIGRDATVVPMLMIAQKSDGERVARELESRMKSIKCRYVIVRVRDQQICALAFDADGESASQQLNTLAAEHGGLRHAMIREGCSVPELPATMDACQKLLEDSWFDIIAEARQTKSAEELLQEATQAFQRLDIDRSLCVLDAAMDQMVADGASREFIERGLIKWHIQLMGTVKELVGIVGKCTFTNMDFMMQIQNASCYSALKAEYARILCMYVREIAAQRDRRGGQMESIKNYIKGHLDGDLRITELARMVRLHPNYLSTLFKEYEGISYRDYIRRERIEEAMRLLRETNLKIYEIAERVGYPDPAHLSRAFKQVTGVSPQQYSR